MSGPLLIFAPLLAPHRPLLFAYSPSLSLAQSGLDLRVFLYIGLLILIAVVGGLFIFAARRRLLSDKNDQNDSNAGLMATLDTMLKNGEITRAEYDQTRRRIIEKTIENLGKPKPQPPEHPPEQPFNLP